MYTEKDLEIVELIGAKKFKKLNENGVISEEEQ